MTLPDRIDSDAELEEILTAPSEADLDCVSRLRGDVFVIGGSGKMGPSPVCRTHRATRKTGSATRVIAASRFSSPDARARLEAAGVSTVACDLLDPKQIADLPRCEHVLFLAGRKFGTLDRTDLTWMTNTVAPAHVGEHFSGSRLVVFSTGNVYALVPAVGPASKED